MAATAGLRIRAFPDGLTWSWEFMAFLLTSGVLALFFLFYFNRLFARIVSVLARFLLRLSGTPRYIDIQSIQISPLAGRIFFGKFTYHGQNETITVVGGHVTWRYWLRRVRHVSTPQQEARTDDPDQGSHTKTGALPCRILVELKGVEWFVYNRSPLYNGIWERLGNGGGGLQGPGAPSTRSSTRVEEEEVVSEKMQDGKHSPKQGSMHAPPSEALSHFTVPPETFEDLAAKSIYLRLLPVKVDCSKGAVILGNKATASLLVAHFDKAQGTIDAKKSNSIDQYKQIYDLSFTNVVVRMTENEDYDPNSLPFRGGSQPPARKSYQSEHTAQHRRRHSLFETVLPMFSHSPELPRPSGSGNVRESGSTPWRGLPRYNRDAHSADTGPKVEGGEYAKDIDILDSPTATMAMYWDVVGKVPLRSDSQPSVDNANVNGSSHPPPEWGMDFSFKDANIHYGPWADRQRIGLQSMFFPKVYRGSTPEDALLPGEDRKYPEMKLFVDLLGSTTLRIPVREPSKDPRYRRRLEEGEIRTPGWLEIKVGNGSSVSYAMAMVASNAGWASSLNLDLQMPALSSSVNNKLLMDTQSLCVRADLSSPLKWCDETKWIFDVTTVGSQIFLLREHVFLFTDLASDWTDGPPSEYSTFVPMIYELNLILKDTEVFLNVNDQNIINNASSVEDNAFITVKHMGGEGGHVEGKVLMDYREFRPETSIIEFSIETITTGVTGGVVEVGMSTPIWNTWNGCLGSPTVGRVNRVRLKGSYETVSDRPVPGVPKKIDTLILELDGEALYLILHGFLIRHFLIIKENYFGENLHFKTLEEWHNGVQAEPFTSDESHDLEIVLGVKATDLTVDLPKHLSGVGERSRFKMACLGLDLRFTNYYMDIQVDLSPITAFLYGVNTDAPQLFVNGLRLYGHRLFGLPPTEPTYVCNWDFGIGDIAGECSLDFIQTTLAALKAFVFSFDDTENALPPRNVIVIHDVTLLRLRIAALQVWIRLSDTNAVRIAAEELTLVLNDLAGSLHSDRIVLLVPGLNIASVNPQQEGQLSTKAYIGTNAKVTVLGRKAEASEQRRLQQVHIRRSDHRSDRSKFFVSHDEDVDSISSSLYSESWNSFPPTMSLPEMPVPLSNEKKPSYGKTGYTATDYGSSSRSTFLSRKSSRSYLLYRKPSSSDTSSVVRHPPSSEASSFYSAAESFSQLSLGSSTSSSGSIFVSPVHTMPGSRGSRSSKRATTPPTRRDTLAFEMTPRPLAVKFSSAFSQPHFPLLDVYPDLTNVPDIGPGQQHPESYNSGRVNLFTDEDAARDSIIVEFPSGIRGFGTNSAIIEIARILQVFQPQTPDDILDAIHIAVVSKLEKAMKMAFSHPKILEVCLSIPQFSFCFINERTRHGKAQNDAVGAQLRGLVVAARFKSIPPSSEGQSRKTKTVFSVHTLMDSMNIGLKDATRSSFSVQSVGKPATGLVVENLLFWASSAESSTASLQIGSSSISALSTQAAFIYDASIRFAVLRQDLGRYFAQATSTEKSKIRSLAYDLASSGESLKITHDPASLTRPSYVLRSAQKHVRLNESWKIAARLRHIWRSFSDNDRAEWLSRYRMDLEEPPPDTRSRFIAFLDKWRGWELGDITDSVVVKHIFGKDTTGNGSPPRLSINAKFKVDSIQILVDPGPSQHQFEIDNLSGTIDTREAAVMNSSLISTAFTTRSPTNTIVHLHAGDVRFAVRWEVVEQASYLVKDLAERIWTKEAKPQASRLISRAKGQKEKSLFGSIHLIATLDKGSVTLDTVNLRSVSTVRRAAASVVISPKTTNLQDGKRGTIGSLLLRSDRARSDLWYRNKVLASTGVRGPSLHVHFDRHSLAETRFVIWNVAALGEEFWFELREQILVIMEVADLVVKDEATQIQRLFTILKADEPDTPPSSPNRSGRTVHLIHGIMSLEHFRYGVKLLPSLSYLVRGHGIRFLAKPNSRDSKETIVDFDVLGHDHEMITPTHISQPRSIALLSFPTIHVTLRGVDGDHGRTANLTASVDAITFEAAAIQSLLNAVTKPEVHSAIESSLAVWEGISSRLSATFGEKEPPPLPNGVPFVYHGSIEVTSLKVQAYAPSANLTLDFGILHANASNMPDKSLPVLSFPEVELEFGKITLGLTRVTKVDPQEKCGYLELHASMRASSKPSAHGQIRTFDVKSHSLKIDLFAETASTVVDVVGHLQDKIKDLDLSREVQIIRHRVAASETRGSTLFNTAMSVEMSGIQISWIVGKSIVVPTSHPAHNLVLSFKRIKFATATHRDSDAQLIIEECLLQMVDGQVHQLGRAANSAMLPRVEFNIAYRIKDTQRRLAFQARGEPLDLRLTSSCVVAGNGIERSISSATQMFREASAGWKSKPTESGAERKNLFGSKTLASVMVDANFEGATVLFVGSTEGDAVSAFSASQQARYGQIVQDEMGGNTLLRSPGLAFKIEYVDPVGEDPTVNAEIKISASDNLLYPSVVPMILEMSNSVKEIMKEQPTMAEAAQKLEKTVITNAQDAGSLATADPAAILGRVRLNIGFRIFRQQFTLSCQPLERVAASASFEGIYVAINTCDESDLDRFYACSATLTGLEASLRHVYSREKAGSVQMESLVLSVMNSKHVTGSRGLSCIVKFGPLKSAINIRQFRDYLVFREIWVPSASDNPTVPGNSTEGLAQRYHEVTSTEAFPSNTTVIVSEIELQVDFGHRITKATLLISNLWGTSRKSSDWEQTLCLGFDAMKVSGEGQLSGFANVSNMKVRSAIAWDPDADPTEPKAPLIEAAIGFKLLQLKIAFEGELFMLGDIGTFDFMMYNVQQLDLGGDRLVAVLDGDKVHLFCTAVSASRLLTVHGLFQDVIQEKMMEFETSLKEIENFLNRRTQLQRLGSQSSPIIPAETPPLDDSLPTGLDMLSLHTDVMVNLRGVFIGVFARTFGDTRCFRVEATGATARFAREVDDRKIHSTLEMVFADFNVEVPSVKQKNPNPPANADINMEEVIAAARSAKGGPVLRVPKHSADMDTWNAPDSVEVDLTFHSRFLGLVTVGWDYSRINFIRALYKIHKEGLAAQSRGEAPISSITVDIVTGSSSTGFSDNEASDNEDGKKKAKTIPNVKVPQSKYIYKGRVIDIETPQMRDLGEATPSLEWMGVNLERLPQVTHQYVIVTLLEVARKVEDRYWKILGSS